ncbi:ComEC family protein [Rahnella sp. PD4]|uniref:ComEC family protein n=2 Tax=Rahnella TaxID=34037 RepID=UPI003BA2E925
MDEAALAVIAGMMPLLIFSELPTVIQRVMLCLCAFCCFRLHHRIFSLIAIGLLSLSWASFQGDIQLHQISALQGTKRHVIAAVESINLGNTSTSSVLFKIEKVEDKILFPPIMFRTNWDEGGQELFAGQRWDMTVSLRPVHSMLNEGGFDAQRWALAQHAPLTATVRHSQPVDAKSSLRQQFIQRVQQKMPLMENTPVLIALAFGEKGLIERADKLLLQQTGIAHLVAISGLHISVAALFGWWLARGIQFLMPVKMIDYRFPLLVSVAFLLTYTWLSGGNAPAVRAALAVSMWILLRLFRVRCHPWQIWLWVVAMLLLADPMNLLSDSFWLSCFAVGALVFWFQWAPLPAMFQQAWYWAFCRWGHLQVGMTLLLWPLQVWIFHGMNLFSFPANMWAVPVVSLFTVPLVLLALLMSAVPYALGGYVQAVLWQLADVTLRLALWGVKALPDGWTPLSESFLVVSLMGWLVLLCWRICPLRYCFSLLLSLFAISFVWMNRNPPERWRIDMLDVGHDLSVLISKNGKGVLYDTGNRWEGGSAAEQNIIPFLNWKNIQLEQIIISHDDKDHRGGLTVLQNRYPAASVRESTLSDQHHLKCIAGEQWRWQGLDFEVLWPEKMSGDARNNDSCVIRIDDGSFSLLLTGDIEAETEKALVRKLRNTLRATALQVPHHGSNTSSIPPFLRAVKPVIVLASASRFNKWHLPAHKVVSRYNKARYDWHSTSVSGQLSLFIFDDYWTIKGLREQLIPRWYHRQFGVSADNE